MKIVRTTRRTSELLDKVLFLLLLAVLLLMSLKTIVPFIGSLLWGTVIAVSIYPLFQRTLRWSKGRCVKGWATLYSVFFLSLLIAPLWALGSEIFNQQEQLKQTMQAFLEDGLPPAPSFLASIPGVGPGLAEHWNSLASQGSSFLNQYRDVIANVLRWIAVQGGSLGLGGLEFALSIVVSGLLLANGQAYIRFTRLLAERLGGAEGGSVVALVALTIRSVSLSVVGTALVQGVLGTLGYWIADVPTPWLLGIATFFLGIVQIGSFPVWIPTALWLLSEEKLGMALFILFWGLFVISLIDNLVRPYLISRGSRLPFVLIFTGVIGGLLAWGFIGIFLGPVFLAIVFRLILHWSKYDQKEPPENPPVESREIP